MKLGMKYPLVIATMFLSALAHIAPVQSQETKQKPDPRFLKWDANKDGNLTRDELPTVFEEFEAGCYEVITYQVGTCQPRRSNLILLGFFRTNLAIDHIQYQRPDLDPRIVVR